MTSKNRIGLGLLLCVAMVLTALCLVPGQTFARYYAGASWSCVIHDTSQTIPILSQSNQTLSIPITVTEAAACTTEKMQADGTYAEYTDGLTAVISGQNAIITLGQTLPPAGTYRLVLRSQDGQTSLQTVIFFVNYSDG